jgi:glycosyltransferase involved in cell wall biosynthesis
MVRKKKVLFHSDFALSKTGFGRNAKAILSYLFSTGKYDLVSLAGGITKNHPDLERTPWKTYGSVPFAGPEYNDCHSHPDKSRMYSYGMFEIDSVVESEKPDVYIGVQDFWGVDYAINKPWFGKLSPVIWTTLDSLPLFNKAVEEAPKIKNYWVWSKFAEDEMHRLGHKHVKTVHGAIDVSHFKPLAKEQKSQLRKTHGIPEDNFLIGFVFRNQLRKSVPNLLQGFKIFKQANPSTAAKLFFHTNWQEGWNIPKLCKETGVDVSDIYTTYVCKNCKSYHVKPFSGPEIDCQACGQQKTLVTTGTTFGVTEGQLNEVYNLMDVYCHPITSGGQEIPIQEAKLTGLVTLVTNYSCGEEMCIPEAASIPLAWSEYREFGTEFIKASTSPVSIAENLKKVLEMPEKEKEKLGKQARRWVIDNFSISSIGEKIERFLDSCPFADYETQEKEYAEKNPYASIPYIADNKLWLKYLYFEILKMEVPDADSGLIHWMERLEQNTSREAIENYFRETAQKENERNKKFKLEDQFNGTKPEDRILVSINSSIENILLATKIISGIKNKYPDKKIFVCSNENAQIVLTGNEAVEDAFLPTKEFNSVEFLKQNFFASYCLDNFSINNGHPILIP